MTLAEALERTLDACSSARVALAGGFALSVHAQPRATVDIDLMVFGAVDDVEAALRATFPSVYRNPQPLTYPLVTVHRFLLIDPNPGGEATEQILDLLEPRNADFAGEAWQRVQRIRFRDRQVAVLSPEALYILKRASDRTQDKADAEALEAARTSGWDDDFIRRWLPAG